jgi:hypothetical protein
MMCEECKKDTNCTFFKESGDDGMMVCYECRGYKWIGCRDKSVSTSTKSGIIRGL